MGGLGGVTKVGWGSGWKRAVSLLQLKSFAAFLEDSLSLYSPDSFRKFVLAELPCFGVFFCRLLTIYMVQIFHLRKFIFAGAMTQIVLGS